MSSDDFKDFLATLSAAGVRHLVVGAYAMASHGHVRATGDLDTWIEPTAENIRRLTLALEEFGGVGLSFFEVTEAELIAAKAGFYMGREPDRIDVHTAIAGLSFADAWRGRISAHSFGVETNVLGLAELIAAKRASGRRRPRVARSGAETPAPASRQLLSQHAGLAPQIYDALDAARRWSTSARSLRRCHGARGRGEPHREGRRASTAAHRRCSHALRAYRRCAGAADQ